MGERKYLKIAFWLTLGGVLFSGYLSLVHILTGACALSEPCPLVLGYPACWYGFAMFLAMFGLTVGALLNKISFRRAVRFMTAISFLGILFAGTLSWVDVSLWISSGRTFALILPTCLYGLIFYIAIFVLSLVKVVKKQA